MERCRILVNSDPNAILGVARPGVVRPSVRHARRPGAALRRQVPGRARPRTVHCTCRVASEARGRGPAEWNTRFEQHASVSYTHLRAHETRHDLVCRLLLEKK